MNIFKFFSIRKILLSGLLTFFPVLVQGQVISHIDQNFEGLNVGPLTSGTDGWAISPGMSAEVVSSPVFEGNRALQISRMAGETVAYSSDGGPNTPLVLAENKNYRWSFAIYSNSATPHGPGRETYVFLDTGSTSSVFAGLRFGWQDSGAGPLFSASVWDNLEGDIYDPVNYSPLALVTENTWVVVDYYINIGPDQKIGTLASFGGLTHTVMPQTSRAGFSSSDYVRMTWSLEGVDAVVGYDNLYLATLPEPASASLFLFGGALCLLGWRPRASLS